MGTIFHSADALLAHQLRVGLIERGYVPGQSIVIEPVGLAEGDRDRLPELASELVRRTPDVIFAWNTLAAQAAMRATSTIPIVVGNSGDPVGAGLVASSSRPGGNVTGVSTLAPQTAPRRLELLRTLAPAISTVAVIWNPDEPERAGEVQAVRAAARTLGLQLQDVEVRGDRDFDPVVDEIRHGRAGAIMALADELSRAERHSLLNVVQQTALPSAFEWRRFVEAGGLMSYGPNLADVFGRVASCIESILKGASPADIPIEQPTRFDFVVNLKAARPLGLTIPQALLDQATEVIQ